MPVRVGRGHQRVEETVVELESVGCVRDEAEVVLEVIAGGEAVATVALLVALDETLHLAATPLVAAAVPGVVGVAEGAALEVRRQAMGPHRVALGVGVAEAAVAAVSPGV